MRVAVILVEPKHEGNVGSVARVMKNFGFEELVLVNPPKLGREARKMAMHASDVLQRARVYGSLEEVKEDYDFLVATSAVVAGDKNFGRVPVLSSDLKLPEGGRVGLVFGREDRGLSNEEIEMCDFLVHIPTSPEYPALNLSHAVAVLLYELSREELASQLKYRLRKMKAAGKEEKELLLRSFGGLVDLVYHDFKARLAKKTFKELIGRAFISGREALTLVGVFRKLEKKLRGE